MYDKPDANNTQTGSQLSKSQIHAINPLHMGGGLHLRE